MDLGTSLWIWERVFGFGNESVDFRTSLWIWERVFGFGSESVDFRASLWIWERVCGFGSESVDLGTSYILLLRVKGAKEAPLEPCFLIEKNCINFIIDSNFFRLLYKRSLIKKDNYKLFRKDYKL